MIATAPTAYVAPIKHNDIKYIIASAKYHQFPVNQVIEKKPIKLSTKFEINQDYTVKTMEDLA